MVRGSAFHLSFYLTLALAMLCLTLAEVFFLEWIPVLLVVLCGVFFLAWLKEGRWELSEQAANSIGLVIAFVMIGWIVLQIPSGDDYFTQGVPWPAGLLPYLGPLLMVLTGAKVFRPKLGADFWILQVLGLMMVTLASVLAGEFHHTIWLFLYLVSLHWCLALHYRQRSGLDAAQELRPLFDAGLRSVTRSRLSGLGLSIAWTCVVSLLGIGIFYVAPRHPSAQWMPHKLAVAATAITTGPDGDIDLNQEGKVELSDEIAFEVVTQNHERKSVDLPEQCYWRSEVVEHYKNGRWLAANQNSDLWPHTDDFDGDRRLQRILSRPEIEVPHPSNRPAEIARDYVYLTIRTRPALVGALVLADPPDPELGVGVNPYMGTRQARSGILAYIDGTDCVVPATFQSRRHGVLYGQVWDADAVGRPRIAGRILPTYRNGFLLQPPPPEIGPFTREFLLRLSGLTEEERTLDDIGRLAPEHHARVARAIAHHLAQAGEYLYSLDLQRRDKKLDAIADFLINVKTGHCERYASGLVLMLRSMNIPCRLVQGYRGSEVTDQNDHIVRFRHAHSWVEALVPGPAGAGDLWIHLDPTPSLEAPVSQWQMFVEHFHESVRQTRNAFRSSILEFNTDNQLDNLAAIWVTSKRWGVAAAPYVLPIGAIVGGLMWLRRKQLARRNASGGAPIRVAWMRSFVDLALRHGNLAPLPQQTWLEFVATVRQAWSDRLPIDVSDSLDRLARSYDQVRYGGEPLSREQTSDLADVISRLRIALAASRKTRPV